MSALIQLRRQLLANGYTPLPATLDKRVILPEWPTLKVDETAITSALWGEFPNTGGRTTDTPVIDIDITDPAAADDAEELIRNRLGDRGITLIRFGLAPKRSIPLRTNTPFAKRRMDYIAPNSARHHIEVLCDGQQAILFGTHPDTRKPYTWHGGRDPSNVPRGELPVVSETEIDELLTDIDTLLTEQHGYSRTVTNTNGHARSAVHVTDVDAAVANFCYAGQGGGGNIHDTSLGVTNALIVGGDTTESAVEYVLAALRIYAAKNPLCARWIWDGERLRLEKMAYSFVNKFPDYADRLPPEHYAARRARQGQGAPDPKIEYDRLRKCWFFPETASAPGSTAQPRAADAIQRCRLIPFNELRLGDEPEHLVEDLIPLHGIVLIWGKRKCLKSFWTYDLNFHIARYQEYRGRKIQSGPVIYCAFENADGYKKRSEALRMHHRVPDNEVVPLYLIPGRINMIKEHPLLIKAIRDQLIGELPRAITLDTLNKSLAGSESKDVDMAAYIAAAEAVREAFDCVVLIVHHCGYDESHARGHTSLPAAVDAEFEVVRQGMLVTVKNITMRDGADDFEIRSSAEIVVVGRDRNGKDITTLVLTPTDAPALPSADRRRGRKDVATPLFIQALRDALAASGGMFCPQGSRAAEHAVRETEVRHRFNTAYPAGEETKAANAKATSEAFKRALKGAVASSVVGKGENNQGESMLWFATPA